MSISIEGRKIINKPLVCLKYITYSKHKVEMIIPNKITLKVLYKKIKYSSLIINK